MTQRSIDWEWRRKAFHSVHGFLVIYLYFALPHYTAPDFLPILLPPCLLFFCLDYARLSSPPLRLLLESISFRSMRPDELAGRQLTSSTAYLCGVLLVLCWFTKETALLAILFLAFGDTAASFAGKAGSLVMDVRVPSRICGVEEYFLGWLADWYGLKPAKHARPAIRVERGNKSLAGFLGGSLCGGIIFALYQYWNGRNMASAWMAGVICGLSECVVIGGVDDDLTMPLLSATLLTAFRPTLGY